jgi:hypothetical protein
METGAAGVVVGAGSGFSGVVAVAVAGVVVPGDEEDAPGLLGIGAALDGVDVDDLSRLRDAIGDRLGEFVGLNIQAIVAIFGDALELGADPFACGPDAAA